MILSYFLYGLYVVLSAYRFVILLAFILTWFPGAAQNKLCRLIFHVADYFMWPFHGILVIGSIDFTGMIGIGIFEGILQLLALIIF